MPLDLCKHCGGNISIRNPSGYCDHLYHPDACTICKRILLREARIEYVKLLVENWLLQLELMKLKIECLILKAHNEWLRFIVWCLGGDPNAN